MVMQALPNTGSINHNYKGTHSLILLAAVDANYLFRYVDNGCHSAARDGGVLQQISLGVQLPNETLNLPAPEPLPGCTTDLQFHFSADEAFPQKPNIMRP